MSTISPEAADLARRAWDAMLRTPNLFAREFEGAKPMPVAVALDMVQDETGDREAAKVALKEEGWKRIRGLFREQVDRDDTESKRRVLPSALGYLDELHVAGNSIARASFGLVPVAPTRVLSMEDSAAEWCARIIIICAFPDPQGDLLRMETYRLAAFEAERILNVLYKLYEPRPRVVTPEHWRPIPGGPS